MRRMSPRMTTPASTCTGTGLLPKRAVSAFHTHGTAKFRDDNKAEITKLVLRQRNISSEYRRAIRRAAPHDSRQQRAANITATLLEDSSLELYFKTNNSRILHPEARLSKQMVDEI